MWHVDELVDYQIERDRLRWLQRTFPFLFLDKGVTSFSKRVMNELLWLVDAARV